MSKLILGGGRFASMDYLAMETLISTAVSRGINTVDTAAGYEGDEARLGDYLKKNKGSNLKIITKLGIPAVYNRNNIRLSPKIITANLNISLKRLGVESIDTLFLHSVDSKDFTDENFEALLKLKDAGKIQRIGYTGDGLHMEIALKCKLFDTLMMTLNCIDQKNMQLASSLALNQHLYIKRALGNVVWLQRDHITLNHFRDLLAQFGWLDENLRKAIGAKSTNGFTSYKFRYQRMFGGETQLNMAEIFLNFALSVDKVNSVLIGTTSIINLSKLLHEEEEERLTDSEFEVLTSLFKQYANRTWGALT